ncbi:MBOAT family O-acyltransferase [Celerinatantimonas sp. YJH-8]|uniref:MBOAT family O-acyltransferase n=1 Tax=Celerinatantimonas sp. YJH-8 TaxID=3228714 RepID=UPI0038C924E6
MVTVLIILYFISALTNSKKLVLFLGTLFSLSLYPQTFSIICIVAFLVCSFKKLFQRKISVIPVVVLGGILIKNTFFGIVDGYQLLGVSFALFQVCYYIKADVSFYGLVSRLSFFPQLYCGPIVKPSGFERLKKLTIKSQALYHCVFAIGLFFKLYLANMTKSVYESDQSIFYSIFWWIYMYSDYLSWSLMGIGIAGLSGFKMPLSFRMPFFTRNISQFWSRWNITVYKWCSDFFKISGRSRYKAYLKILVSVSVLSLWHGATVGFFMFGLINLLLFIIQNKIKRKRYLLLISQVLFFMILGFPFNNVIPHYLFPCVNVKQFLFVTVSIFMLILFDVYFYKKIRGIVSSWPMATICVCLVFVTFSFFVRHLDGIFYYAQF